MKIGVAGSTIEKGDPYFEKIEHLGEIIAERGHTLVTGACDGSPYTVSSSAYKRGAKVIAFSPGRNLDEHKNRFGFPTDSVSEFRFIPSDFQFVDVRGACLKLRNVYWVTFADVVIIVRGKTGTLNEFTIAYDLGKVIGVLKGSGGVSDSIPQLVEMLQKPSGSVFVYSEDPVELVDRLEVHAHDSG